jgi:hypothetical protein
MLFHILNNDMVESMFLFVDQSAVDPGQREDERVPV